MSEVGQALVQVTDSLSVGKPQGVLEAPSKHSALLSSS